jgi:hypothetical protein
MQKPVGYDQAQAQQFSGGDRLAAGPYVLGIVKAEEATSKSGRPMIVFSLDIADGPNKNYYKQLGERLQKDCYLKHRRVTDGDQVNYFKGDIKAIEESNPGYTFNFDERTLTRKLVGANLREEEYASGGDIKTSLKIAFLCPAQYVRDGKIKPLECKRIEQRSYASSQQSFAPTDDLPW